MRLPRRLRTWLLLIPLCTLPLTCSYEVSCRDVWIKHRTFQVGMTRDGHLMVWVLRDGVFVQPRLGEPGPPR